MDIKNTEKQMRKGILEFCILSIIRQKEVYPSEIIDGLKEANLQILEGTLYPLLTRIKNTGLLNYRWEESPSGPPRKYFSLTDKGEEAYQQLLKSWKELEKSVQTIIKEKA